ncbi:MAG: sigma 54-interacting transcriptional regulator [Bacillota bacterium]
MPELKARDVMTRSFLKAQTGMPLGKIRELAEDEGFEAVVFYHGEEIKGVIGREALLRSLEQGIKTAEFLFGKGDPVRVSGDDPAGRVISLINQVAGGLLVIEENSVAGVITAEILMRRLYREREKSQAYLDTLLNYASEAICAINDKEEVEYWNPRAEILYGIKEKDIKGRLIGDFFTNILVSQSIKNKKVFREVYHQPRDGAHVLITSVPVSEGDKRVIGSLSLERDIADIVYFNEELSKTSFKVSLLKNEINRLSRKDAFSKIYGHSTVIKETIKIAKKYAATEATLLITGESGSGKELFAQAIHEESDRRDKPFVAVNCSAIPQTLFESEIFGYEGGSFTGAFKEGKPGKFELAHGGTLFLDEIGDLDPGAQVKLLRVLQEKVLYRIGGTRPVKVDVRIIAATNRNLENLVKDKIFREDLFYRLNVIMLQIPSLRERREDMPELVYLLTQELAAIHGKKINGVDPEIMVAFMNCNWPGNVRELRNVLERMVILEEEEMLTQSSLPDYLRYNASPGILISSEGTNINLNELTEQTERQIIVEALKKAANNKAEAARALGIPRSSLYYRMKVLGLVTEN